MRGNTLHQVLKLSIQHGNFLDDFSLSLKALQDLQQKFKGVQILIIDEISLVSSSLLSCIHDQLCTIANGETPNIGLILIETCVCKISI